MRLYKRGKYWWASWTEDSETVKRTTRCTTREAAALVVARWERERADPAHHATQTARFSVESAQFLCDVHARKGPAGTLNMYECKVGHLNRLMPEFMRDVDVIAVDEYFDTRKAEGASGSTLHKEWVALRGVLRTAARRGRWTGQLEILKPSWISPASAERTRRLTWDELAALLEHAPPELGDVVRYAVATGARRSELGRAQEGDCNGNGTALIRGSKTEESWKTIPIPPLFRRLVPARAWGVAPTGKLMFRDLPADLRCLNSACEAAKIDPVSYNDLRRTFASMLIDAGVTNTVTAKLLRHKSTAMVDKHYGKSDDGALAALVASQAAVPMVSHQQWNGDVSMVLMGSKTRVFVGQDGLEPSANGLRDLCGGRFPAEYPETFVSNVPMASHRLPAGDTEARLLALLEGGDDGAADWEARLRTAVSIGIDLVSENRALRGDLDADDGDDQ